MCGLILLCAIFLWQHLAAQQPFEVATQEALFSALIGIQGRTQETTILITADLRLDAKTWDSVQAPIPIACNLTLKGHNSADPNRTSSIRFYPVINFELINEKIMLMPGVILTLQSVIGSRSRTIALDSGIDLIGPSPNATLRVIDYVRRYEACIPPLYAIGPINNYTRPVPGRNNVSVENGGWCRDAPLPRLCWGGPNATTAAVRMTDFADLLTEIDPGKPGVLRTSFLYLMSNSWYVCEELETFECLQTLGPRNCAITTTNRIRLEEDAQEVAAKTPSAPTASPFTPSVQPPAAFDGDGKSDAAHKAAIAAPAALGGAALLAGLALTRILFRRARARRAAATAADAAHSNKSAAAAPDAGNVAFSSLQPSGGASYPRGGVSSHPNDVSIHLYSGVSTGGMPTPSSSHHMPSATPSPGIGQRTSALHSSAPELGAHGFHDSAGYMAAVAAASGPVPPHPLTHAPHDVLQPPGSHQGMHGITLSPASGGGLDPTSTGIDSTLSSSLPYPWGTTHHTATFGGSGPGSTGAAVQQGVTDVITGGTPAIYMCDLQMRRDQVQLSDKVLGKGSYGLVVQGLYRNQLVAVKLLSVDVSEREMSDFKTEVEILSKLSHPNIVRLLGACLERPHLCLALELCYCSLDKLIHKPEAYSPELSTHENRDGQLQPAPPTLLPLPQVLAIAKDIAMGLAYLHPTVVHRDLKPANILLDTSGRAKIGDFGIARLRGASTLITQHPEAGTVAYMAPECFDPEVHELHHRCDIWSWGVLLWEMLMGETPHKGLRSAVIVYNVLLAGRRLPLPTDGARCPPRISKLLALCWDRDPLKRPSALDLVKEVALVQQSLAVPAPSHAPSSPATSLMHIAPSPSLGCSATSSGGPASDPALPGTPGVLSTGAGAGAGAGAGGNSSGRVGGVVGGGVAGLSPSSLASVAEGG